MSAPITVLKFGSSVLADRNCLGAVVHDIYRVYRRGHRVVVVVSAIGRHTDVLLEEARHLATPPLPEAALAKLLATGEEQSAALLTIATHRAGIPCQLLEPADIRLVLHGERLDADPYSINTHALEHALSRTPVVILPGFAGTHEHGGTALLGRGGSDLTAVFIAEKLDADECRLVKDVDGIYECDPAEVPSDGSEPQPKRYAEVTYSEALRVAGPLVQPKAIEYLQCTRRAATVTALLQDTGSVVSAASSRYSQSARPRPTRVVLLGLGTLGQIVYSHLQALPNEFEVIGVAVRDRHKPRNVAPPCNVLSEDLDALLGRDFDVLIDACDDPQAANVAIETTLRVGRAAITASPSLINDFGAALFAAAELSGGCLHYSAAAGGAVPMLECVDRAREAGDIAQLRVVLGGPGNTVLDAIAAGATQVEAVTALKRTGMSEAETDAGLSGEDAAQTLRLLAARAWGHDGGNASIARQGVESITREQLHHAHQKHRKVVLLAQWDSEGSAFVKPCWLLPDEFLADGDGTQSRLQVRIQNGTEHRVVGSGGSAWSTAEAVIADLIDIRTEKHDKHHGQTEGSTSRTV